MLQKLRVLQAGVALHRFTARDVAAYADVPEATVRTVLDRHRDWFPVVDKLSTGRRGGRWNVREATSNAAAAIADLFEENRQVFDDLGSPPGIPAPPPAASRLAAAEQMLLRGRSDAASLANIERTIREVEEELRHYPDPQMSARTFAAETLIATIRGEEDAFLVEAWDEAVRDLVTVGELDFAQQLVAKAAETEAAARIDLPDPTEVLPVNRALVLDAIAGPDEVTDFVLGLLGARKVPTSHIDIAQTKEAGSVSVKLLRAVSAGLEETLHGLRGSLACFITADRAAKDSGDLELLLSELHENFASVPVVLVAKEHDPDIYTVAIERGIEYTPIAGLGEPVIADAFRMALLHIVPTAVYSESVRAKSPTISTLAAHVAESLPISRAVKGVPGEIHVQTEI